MLFRSRAGGAQDRCASRSFLAAIAGTRRSDIRHVDFRLTRAGRTLRVHRDALRPHTMRVVRRGLLAGRTYRLAATVKLHDERQLTLTRTFRAC